MHTIRLGRFGHGWMALVEDNTTGRRASTPAGLTREEAVGLAFTMVWLQIRLTPRRRRVSPLPA